MTAIDVFLAAKTVFEAELAANRDDGVVVQPPGVAPPSGGTSRLKPEGDSEAPVDVMVRVAERCRQLQADGHLEVLKRHWPQGVPTPKGAAASGYTFTSVERIDIQQAVTAAEREAYAAEPAAIEGMVKRLQGLAPDLFAQVTVNAKRDGVPNLTSALVTSDDVKTAERHLVDAEAIAEERWAELTKWVDSGLADMSLVPLEWLTFRSEKAPPPTWGTLTGLEVELAVKVLSALADDLIVAGDDGFVANVEQEFRIVDLWGGKKSLVAGAKAAADRHGLGRPRSTAAAMSDPLIVALVADGPE